MIGAECPSVKIVGSVGYAKKIEGFPLRSIRIGQAPI